MKGLSGNAWLFAGLVILTLGVTGSVLTMTASLTQTTAGDADYDAVVTHTPISTAEFTSEYASSNDTQATVSNFSSQGDEKTGFFEVAVDGLGADLTYEFAEDGDSTLEGDLAPVELSLEDVQDTGNEELAVTSFSDKEQNSQMVSGVVPGDIHDEDLTVGVTWEAKQFTGGVNPADYGDATATLEDGDEAQDSVKVLAGEQ